MLAGARAHHERMAGERQDVITSRIFRLRLAVHVAGGSDQSIRLLSSIYHIERNSRGSRHQLYRGFLIAINATR
jgi:hypothetical protein